MYRTIQCICACLIAPGLSQARELGSLMFPPHLQPENGTNKDLVVRDDKTRKGASNIWTQRMVRLDMAVNKHRNSVDKGPKMKISEV